MAKKWISALVALEANFLLAGKGLVIKKKKKYRNLKKPNHW